MSKRNLARTAYSVDRAVQSTLSSPALVASWERATAAVRQTWIGYVNGFLADRTVPTLAADAHRTAAFAACLRALVPFSDYTPGQAHGHPYAIVITPGNTSEAHPNTLQFTAVVTDFYGDVLTSLAADVVWHSSDVTNVTIDAAGLATTVSTGPSNITATISNGFGVTITSNTSVYTVT